MSKASAFLRRRGEPVLQSAGRRAYVSSHAFASAPWSGLDSAVRWLWMASVPRELVMVTGHATLAEPFLGGTPNRMRTCRAVSRRTNIRGGVGHRLVVVGVVKDKFVRRVFDLGPEGADRHSFEAGEGGCACTHPISGGVNPAHGAPRPSGSSSYRTSGSRKVPSRMRDVEIWGGSQTGQSDGGGTDFVWAHPGVLGWPWDGFIPIARCASRCCSWLASRTWRVLPTRWTWRAADTGALRRHPVRHCSLRPVRRFTWWNAVLFSLYALSDGTWLSGITVMTTLLVVTGGAPPLDRLRRCPPRSTGVVLMSLRGCSLLQEAVDDMGAGGYILGAMPVLPGSAVADSTAGTFAVHYLPCPRGPSPPPTSCIAS